ncbi:hypothetical protein Zmor_015867 [Zophobas morio]|uniref:Uncharacterized protein n=1 Tax=Zophobas morio TaxID=2755281 RepID=A0AA38IHK8_9CUCU|nr:hypothetical protein Zmor_015867 [Zophobas morio]
MLEGKKKEAGKEHHKGRQGYYERLGYAWMEIARKREMGVSMREELCMRDRDIDKQERRASVSKSRYNVDYRKIITKTIPKYLDRESAKEKKIIARFRCGNEERNNKFWVSEGERMCRMCGEGRETIERMMHDCEESKGREEGVTEEGWFG